MECPDANGDKADNRTYGHDWTKLKTDSLTHNLINPVSNNNMLSVIYLDPGTYGKLTQHLTDETPARHLTGIKLWKS